MCRTSRLRDLTLVLLGLSLLLGLIPVAAPDAQCAFSLDEADDVLSPAVPGPRPPMLFVDAPRPAHLPAAVEVAPGLVRPPIL
ncbi:MAG: hypothetical protein ACM3MF_11750 [Anaerolineae bacterium]